MREPKCCGAGWPPSNIEPVFDNRADTIAELRRRVGAASAGPEGGSSRVLPVPPALAEALPRKGLPGGSVVSLNGQGMTSMLFALLSGSPTNWSALVGMPDVGMLAASELGVNLDRVVLVPRPGPDVFQVLSILLDGVDMVAVSLPASARPTPGRLRVLHGRLRQRGAVLLALGPWPGADLVLTGRLNAWTGIGRGHGRLLDRQLVVDIAGRGAAGRARRVSLLFRGSRSAVHLGSVDGVGAVDLAHGPAVQVG